MRTGQRPRARCGRRRIQATRCRSGLPGPSGRVCSSTSCRSWRRRTCAAPITSESGASGCSRCRGRRSSPLPIARSRRGERRRPRSSGRRAFAARLGSAAAPVAADLTRSANQHEVDYVARNCLRVPIGGRFAGPRGAAGTMLHLRAGVIGERAYDAGSASPIEVQAFADGAPLGRLEVPAPAATAPGGGGWTSRCRPGRRSGGSSSRSPRPTADGRSACRPGPRDGPARRWRERWGSSPRRRWR